MESGRIDPLQLRHDGDAWRILVTCILLNLTTREAVEDAMDGFFAKWPNPVSASTADVSQMGDVLRPLGLWRRRTRSIVRLSNAWVVRWGNGKSCPSPSGLPGVGQYAVDAWKIFCSGERDFVPRDRMLRAYLRRLKSEEPLQLDERSIG
jgi:methyl-CpG-binding domain protein 4